MRTFAGAVIFAFFVLSAGSARAATILVDDSTPEFALVTVEGKFLLTDVEKFRQKVAAIPKAVVVFQSEGGNLHAGIQIGTIIRTRNYSTFVPSRMLCASACALAWLGGTSRYMGSKALVGFHAAYDSRDGRESVPNALVGSYLNQIGLPERAIIYITSAPPTSLNYLNIAAAKEFGIDVALFDLEKDTPRVDPPVSHQPAPTTSPRLRERAQQFLDLLYVTVSGDSEQIFGPLNNFYGDKIVYFGETLSREETVTRIQRFLARWPIRRYRPKDGTVAINCNEVTLTCIMKGIVNFDARSPERNEHSYGEATFEYRLSFASPNESPKIVAEDGKILKREKNALNTAQPLDPLLDLLGLKRLKRISQP